AGAAEEELINVAIRSMGLSELKTFEPNEKIIELKMEAASPTNKSLVKMNVRQFCNETLSDSPAPGGGSVAALMGALGVALGGMASKGNPASISDVGVGLLAIRGCIEGAGMNVRINAAALKDKKFKTRLLGKVQVLSGESDARFKKIKKLVEKNFS